MNDTSYPPTILLLRNVVMFYYFASLKVTLFSFFSTFDIHGITGLVQVFHDNHTSSFIKPIINVKNHFFCISTNPTLELRAFINR